MPTQIKTIFAACLGLIAAMISTLPVHTGTQEGRVLQIIVRASDGLNYLYLDGAATGRPACSGASYWMIKDENSTAGKAQLAMLMTAYALGKSVRIIGTNTCTRWSDGEDINEVYLLPD